MTALHIKLEFADYGKKIFDQKIQQIKSHKGDVYIWDDVHAWLTHIDGITMLKNIRRETENKLYLVCRGNSGLPADYLGFEVIDFNWPIIDFMKLHDIFFQKYLMNPENNRDNFLFLTGKPLGYHRVGLLYKIWKHNLIEKCQYSFFGNNNEFRDSCSQYIDIEDRQAFFNEVKNQSPDRVTIAHSGIAGFQSLHYSGIPYDTSLYEQTQFSVVTETHSWRGPPYCPTEKLWRTILNCHPFLLAGQPGMVDHLESMGFDCYRSFLRTDYLSLSNEWTHDDNEQLISNIKYWLVMAEEDWTEIQKIAVKNQKIFFSYLQKNKDIFEKILTTIDDVKVKNNIWANIW